MIKLSKRKQSYGWEEYSGHTPKQFFIELIKVIVISFAIIVPIRFFLVQPFYVKGASMEPNFHDNEYLLIDEITYRFEEPSRGDIVVFRYPRDPRQFFIKRVIGLPGEEIRLKDSKITIFNQDNVEGFTLDESPYIPDNVKTPGESSVILGLEEYYVMGDNRFSSLDSRFFGPIKRHLIVGRTFFRGWPINKMQLFSSLKYDSN